MQSVVTFLHRDAYFVLDSLVRSVYTCGLQDILKFDFFDATGMI